MTGWVVVWVGYGAAAAVWVGLLLLTRRGGDRR
jgi:hypothetical protein